MPSGFLNDALLTVTGMVSVASVDARQCSLSEADLVMFTTADLIVENGEQAKAIGEAIKAGQLIPLFEALAPITTPSSSLSATGARKKPPASGKKRPRSSRASTMARAPASQSCK